MLLPTRPARQYIFNAVEVALFVLIVIFAVRFFTTPGPASVVRVTREANALKCGRDDVLDLRGAVKIAVNKALETKSTCKFRSVNVPDEVSLVWIPVIGLAAALALWLTGRRGALLRPWGRQVGLAIAALTVYPAVMIGLSFRSEVAEQDVLLGRLTTACADAKAAIEKGNAATLDSCRKQGYPTLEDCTSNNPLYTAALDSLIGSAVERVVGSDGSGATLSCAVPALTGAEAARQVLTFDMKAPEAEQPDNDTKSSPAGPGSARAPNGSDARGSGSDDNGDQGDQGNRNSEDRTGSGDEGYAPPGGCSPTNCEEPAKCDGKLCRPPPRTDRVTRRVSKRKTDANILKGMLGLAFPVAWLLVNGAGETEDTEVTEETLVDEAVTAKQHPESQTVASAEARGARRTGDFADSSDDHVASAAKAELARERSCLDAIQKGSKSGCDVKTIDELVSMFSSNTACNGVVTDTTGAHLLREWVAKCFCQNNLAKGISREIQCTLP